MIALCYNDALGEGGYPRDVRWLTTALHELGMPVALCAMAHGEQTREGLHPDVPIWDIDRLRERSGSIHCAHFFGIFITDQMEAMTTLQKRGIPLILSPCSHLLPLALVKSKWRKKLFLTRYSQLFHSISAWSVFSETEWNSVTESFGKVTGERVFGGLGHYPTNEAPSVRVAPEPNPRFQILFFGRCDVWQKGIDILLDSYTVLCAICNLHQIPKPMLTIAGKPHGDSESVIGSRMSGFPAGDVIRLQNVADSYISAMFLNSDLFVYLSRFDGPPRPVRMAIKLGIPVLASLEANMSEELALLNAGTTTTLRPDAVATRIFESMCAEPGHERIARTHPISTSDWSWGTVARHYARVYSRFLHHETGAENHPSDSASPRRASSEV